MVNCSASNGTPAPEEKVGEKTAFLFTNRDPMASYLVTIAIAELSYHFVEQPVRLSAALARRGRSVIVSGLAASAVVGQSDRSEGRKGSSTSPCWFARHHAENSAWAARYRSTSASPCSTCMRI